MAGTQAAPAYPPQQPNQWAAPTQGCTAAAGVRPCTCLGRAGRAASSSLPPSLVVCFSPQAGHELLLLCESDAGARQVLRQAFPGVRIHEDVTSLERLPEVGGWLSCGVDLCMDEDDAGAYCRESWR